MALYTKKKGQYVQMTGEQVRRLRRTTEVNELLTASRSTALMLKGVSMWLAGVEKNSGKASPIEVSIVSSHRINMNKQAQTVLDVCNKIRSM